MYLKSRLCLPIHSNPGIVFPKLLFDGQDEGWLSYANFLHNYINYDIHSVNNSDIALHLL